MVKIFDIFLTHEDRCGAELHIEHGHVKEFSIRYDAYIDGAWRNVVLFDAHGGSAHWHMVDPITGKGEKQGIALDLKSAVTYAFSPIKERWKEWREQYARRLRGDEQQDLL